MPRPIHVGNKRVNLYDEEYECLYDEIDPTGLDIWSYARCLKEEKDRNKLLLRNENIDIKNST